MGQGKTKDDYAEDYTEPALRERLKDELKAGDRGGRPGQWSARKSQLLTHEYERHGGGYRHPGERTEAQHSLESWSEEEWQTADGDAAARHGARTERYLPKAAWELMSKAEREATGQRKRDGSEQHVANTTAAREAKHAAELLELTAPEAVKAVRRMEGRSLLRRARRAEERLGKGRKTVLEAIDRRLEQM